MDKYKVIAGLVIAGTVAIFAGFVARAAWELLQLGWHVGGVW